MKIDNNIEIVDLCIFLKEQKVLVFGDVHIGYEEALNNKGVLVPRQQYKMTLERLEKTLDKLDVETVIINGDLKHEFGTILRTEWKDVFNLVDFLLSKCKRLIIMQGNHDKILKPIADKKNVEFVKSFVCGSVLITHGDFIPVEASDCKTIIIGHEHPAISIAEYPRIEKYKCFLVGKWKTKKLIVMPSYNLLTEGTDVLFGKFLSPFIENLDNFNVYVVGDQILDFGKVKEIRKSNG